MTAPRETAVPCATRGEVINRRASAGARCVETREAVLRAKSEDARAAAIVVHRVAFAEYEAAKEEEARHAEAVE